MAGAMGRDRHASSTRGQSQFSVAWDKKMCGQVAWALVIHTLLLIFFVTTKMESDSISIMPYFALVLMVAVYVVIGRWFDRRWRVLANSELSNTSLGLRYRLDVTMVWLTAIGIPFLWAALLSVL